MRDGYDATSMSKLAAHAGVTANTLYWYFRDKDELLVAVADRYLDGLLRHHAAIADRPLADQLRWLVESLRPVKHLEATVHNRVAAAESVATWHTGFHRSIEALFERQLPGPVPAERRAAEAPPRPSPSKAPSPTTSTTPPPAGSARSSRNACTTPSTGAPRLRSNPGHAAAR